MGTLIAIYLIIAVLTAFATILWLDSEEVGNIDGFWDWVIYSLFWIVLPIKAIVRYLKNLI